MRIISFVILFWPLSISLPANAQAEKYDIITITPPSGWTKEETLAKISWAASDSTGHWCRISVYKSIDSKGSAELDFKNDWFQLVIKTLSVKEKPADIGLPAPQGWERKTAGASYDYKGARASVILSTFSANGKTVSLLAITNSKIFDKYITTFFADVILTLPEKKRVVNSPAKLPPPLTGSWQKENETLYAQAYKGYRKNQYSFNKNGSYEFYSKIYSERDTAIYFLRESGFWLERGKVLTVSPTKSNLESWSRKKGTDQYGDHMNARPMKIARTDYEFSIEYFAGINDWKLVLHTFAVTERDGPFSNNPSYQKSWLYSPMTGKKPPLELPEQNSPEKKK